MEHRYDKRFPADHKTLIFKNGMPVGFGRVRNFSRGGIFIKTEFNAIDVNQSLEIELGSHNHSVATHYGERCLCKTLVMHKTSDGMGLMLREDCADTQNNFSAFVAEELARSQIALNVFTNEATPSLLAAVSSKGKSS